ncbi:MAG TPA: xanthine dehydrogenase family protein molybdopterin-binding subunit [Alphaproteobacteria bacterium]|jgi:carbon-monoxide dehydrogenase large subunit|nr:xanthine dehydrogenase family protein molybdopterin-binding subunit [Alphaproteobacteria bacterium]
MKFGVGQPVTRLEDPRLLRGEGCFLDDITLPDQAYGWIVRSPYAHARIITIDDSEARALPGVLAVLTGVQAAADGLGGIVSITPQVNRDGSPAHITERPVLVAEVARCIGDPVALVVAESQAQARDAAELVAVDYDPLPACIGPEAALEPDAPQVWPEVAGNLGLDYEDGDAAAVDTAFAAAHNICRLRLENQRITGCPLENRGAIGDYAAADGRYTLHLSGQDVMGTRSALASQVLRIDPGQLRVITPDVGGGFGTKGYLYPEYGLVCWAAKKVGRPVKWVAGRDEAFISDAHARALVSDVSLALDAEGRFLAVRLETVADLGAYVSAFALHVAAGGSARTMSGPYHVPALHVRVRGVFTHTSWVDAFRGAGQPEGAYLMNRIIDAAARQMNLGREEIRRRNLVPPSAMPYTNPLGHHYDSGNFPATFERALELADSAGFEDRRRHSEERGLLRGFGLSAFVEVTSEGPPEWAAIEFLPERRVRLKLGSQDQGQGHRTTMLQLLSERLGLGPENVDFVQGDSDVLSAGSGSWGSKTSMLAGTAIAEASDRVITRARPLAADELEVAEADVVFEEGRFRVQGTDLELGLMDLAAGLEDPATLDDSALSTSAVGTYPNGSHVCEVEIDPETGFVAIVGYSVVGDFGTVLNPRLVAGQIHGGVGQGIGQALLEDMRYDADGQVITGSFVDYALPRADDVPSYALDFKPTPCTTNALGIKGVGEAGTIGALAAVINAVDHALEPLGVNDLQMPATPHRIWQAIQRAGGGDAPARS